MTQIFFQKILFNINSEITEYKPSEARGGLAFKLVVFETNPDSKPKK